MHEIKLLVTTEPVQFNTLQKPPNISYMCIHSHCFSPRYFKVKKVNVILFQCTGLGLSNETRNAGMLNVVLKLQSWFSLFAPLQQQMQVQNYRVSVRNPV